MVMITEDNDAISEFSALNSGVYVISTQVYSSILCPVKSLMLTCQMSISFWSQICLITTK